VKVVNGLEQLDPPLQRCVLTVGNFDGVHAGHQEILRRAKDIAQGARAPVAALTFDPHPLVIVAPAKAPLRLMSVDERTERLGESGAEIVVVGKSAPALLGMEAERFITDVLRDRFHPAHIVEGTSFGFGKGRKGTPELLRQVAGTFGCQVHIVEPVSVEGEDGQTLLVSSSLIRKLLMEGDVANAARCLGRPYAIESIVVLGAGRGRAMGFPTANFHTPAGQVEPGEGVYAGVTWVGKARYGSAVSIGRAETFGGGKRQVESHLLNFTGDLYDKMIRVEFLSRIRSQRKFASAVELVQQIQWDIEEVRKRSAVILSEAKNLTKE